MSATADIAASMRQIETVSQKATGVLGNLPIALAAAGLLNPLIAGLAMALSSVSVVGHALRLRRFEPGDGA